MTRQDVDLLVIGSGIAGLSAALTAASRGREVVVVTKGSASESNTRYAQGGIAAPFQGSDSPDLHAADTVTAAAGLADPKMVGIMTSEAQEALQFLIDAGTAFDSDAGRLITSREGAHSLARVLHAGGDSTGHAIQSALVQAAIDAGVTVLERGLASKLLMDGGRVIGALFLFGHDGLEMSVAVHATRTLLATGGAGQMYARTTNPAIATADGPALAYRAGAELADLEFFQFHPTALALEGAPAFLISEAARGEGGILRDLEGRRFMPRYHRLAELAPRDVVARAIFTEMQRQTLPHVLLDLTELQGVRVRSRFPTISAFCDRYDIDVDRRPIPVSPAAHYFMGGIRTDAAGRTSLPGLFAAGEAACTGVHGANRLASNSLLEGVVFGRRAALAGDEAVEQVPQAGATGYHHYVEWHEAQVANDVKSANDRPSGTHSSLPPSDVRRKLQLLNWQHLGLRRDSRGLDLLSRELEGLIQAAETTAENQSLAATIETLNLLLISQLAARAAATRTESRGAHFRSDAPESSRDWLLRLAVSRGEWSRLPVGADRRELVAV
ncbi:MAG TPA: L-aspartate oxidase [Chloroflexota bacterium]|nr:L-aspartate oxidase [Chloroflexota bacterium]